MWLSPTCCFLKRIVYCGGRDRQYCQLWFDYRELLELTLPTNHQLPTKAVLKLSREENIRLTENVSNLYKMSSQFPHVKK